MMMLLLLVGLVGVSAQPMPETMKCSACKEIAASLEFEYVADFGKGKDETMAAGHRMQANAKQKRKLKYVGSEAMAFDVMEKVCNDGIAPRGKFVLEDALGKAEKHQMAQAGKSLTSFCHILVEEYEDGIKDQIQRGVLFAKKDAGKKVKRWLCYRQSKLCTADKVMHSAHYVRTIPEHERKKKPPFTMSHMLEYGSRMLDIHYRKVWAILLLLTTTIYFKYFADGQAGQF